MTLNLKRAKTSIVVYFRREIVELTFENSVFESNLERKKSEPITYTTPSMATTNLNSSQTTPTGSNQDLTTVGGSSRGERYARKRSKSRSTQGDFRIALTLDQKVAVIVSEHDHMKNEENRREAANEKKLDQLEVCLSSIVSIQRRSRSF